ncbi:hypothetical protein ACSVDA_24300 [Cytobacillus sp. Hm23]
MSWKKRYAIKQKCNPFDELLIKTNFRKVIQEINGELSQHEIEEVRIAENNIIFPDCIISFEITQNHLQFRKFKKDNPSSVRATFKVNLHSDGYFRFNIGSEEYEEVSEDLIEDLFEKILFHEG